MNRAVLRCSLSIGYATNECTGDKFNASPVDGYITLTADDPYGGPDAAMAALLNGSEKDRNRNPRVCVYWPKVIN
jgi:hypothetical protein